MKPIYKPKGRAKEYGELAINIYSGCNHGCIYCYAPLVLKRDRVEFHANVEPRKGIVEAVKRQLDREQIAGKLIHLCFTCDPYPAEIDTTPTREVIKAIKEAGNHVQILTKGGKRAVRDFDLLDSGDMFGVTLTTGGIEVYEGEPGAATAYERILTLGQARQHGIKTWVSLEPVIDPEAVYGFIKYLNDADIFRIGKMNYHASDISWAEFGAKCEALCKEHGREYYIKADLQIEMRKGCKA